MTEQKFHVGVKALIMNDKKEVLVLKANPEDAPTWPHHWDLPGGRIKETGSIEQTLYRELEEEIGTNKIEILELFDTCVANHKIPLNGEEISLLLVTYKCKLLDSDQKFKLNFEHLEYRWASINEAKELLKVKFANSFIEKLDSLKP